MTTFFNIKNVFDKKKKKQIDEFKKEDIEILENEYMFVSKISGSDLNYIEDIYLPLLKKQIEKLRELAA